VDEECQPSKITYSMFLFNKRSFFAYMSCSLIGIYTSFNYGFLSLVLQDFGLTDSEVGYVFAIPCLTYATSSIFVSYIVSKYPRRLIIFSSFLMFSVSLLLLGPSMMLGMPNYLWILIIGYGINGCAQGFIYTPLLPEIIDTI
jgi:MFS family permease